jgi:phosphoglycolate phosphatase-like HAD superfamily hydrolase
MLQLIVQELNLDVGQTWMIGDKESDVASAKAAQITGAVLTMTGYGAESSRRAMLHADHNLRVLVAKDLREIPPLLERA